MNKFTIKTASEENWDTLLDEFGHIERVVAGHEQNISALNNAVSTQIVTVSSLIEILVEKKLVTKEEIDNMSAKIGENLKKEAKIRIDENKDTNKKSLYDTLLNSDFMGNS